jgi:hypothetical protein
VVPKSVQRRHFHTFLIALRNPSTIEEALLITKVYTFGGICPLQTTSTNKHGLDFQVRKLINATYHFSYWEPFSPLFRKASRSVFVQLILLHLPKFRVPNIQSFLNYTADVVFAFTANPEKFVTHYRYLGPRSQVSLSLGRSRPLLIYKAFFNRMIQNGWMFDRLNHAPSKMYVHILMLLTLCVADVKRSEFGFFIS